MLRELRKILVLVVLLGLCFPLFQGSQLALAKDPDYPTRPITFYICFGPGATDTLMRTLLDVAGKHLGQPFIPVNKPGAGGTVTSIAVMNAKPDGYTLGNLVASSTFVAPHSGDVPYKDLSVFTMIANVGTFVYPLMVKGDAPWKTWKELVEWSRKNPRKASTGITGAKPVSVTGMVLWEVEKKEQVEFTYVTLKGNADILASTLGGHITMYGGVMDGTLMEYIKEGKLRILTYLGPDKVPGYENIPSLQDLYGFSVSSLIGIAGPKGLPDHIVKKLEDTFAIAVKDPEFINIMNRLYLPINYMDRIRMQKHTNEMFTKTGNVMRLLRGEEEGRKK